MFTPWKCGDCGAHGKIRHELQHTAADIGRWTMAEHKRKSPACHQKAVKEARESAQLTPRDRHILITARIKRKLCADALRVQRSQERASAVVAFRGRWTLTASYALTPAELIAAYTTAGSPTRKNWLAGKATRKGYAFT